MDQILIKALKDIGFTKKEANVYLALLELSRGTVTHIAQLTGLKRSIIYVILNGLAEKGYITELPSKKINEYQAIDPSIIIRGAKLSIKNITELLPLMRTLHNKGKERPKIQFIENREAILKIFNNTTYVKNSIFITSYKRVDEFFPGAINVWVKNIKTIKDDLNVRHLVPNNPDEIKLAKKFKQVGQSVKVLESTKKYDMDLMLYGNKFFVTSLEEQPFMVIIESQGLANSMKLIFETMWRCGKEV